MRHRAADSCSKSCMLRACHSITCLVQAMLELKDTGALLSFVKRPNRIDLREAETALRGKGR